MDKNKTLTPEEIVKYFKDEFKTQIKDSKIKRHAAGSKKNESVNIWLKIDKSIFKNFIKHLLNLQSPHFAVTSGNDLGKIIELIYHFTLNYDKRISKLESWKNYVVIYMFQQSSPLNKKC